MHRYLLWLSERLVNKRVVTRLPKEYLHVITITVILGRILLQKQAIEIYFISRISVEKVDYSDVAFIGMTNKKQ